MIEGEDLVARIISCSIKLEEYIAKVYSKLADKLEYPEALTLKHIARESLNHASLLRDVSQVLSLQFKPENCQKLIGSTYESLEKLVSFIESTELDKVNVDYLLSELKKAENSMSEEIYHSMIFNIIKDMFPEPQARIVDRIVDEIICEERYHHKLMEEAILVHFSKGVKK